MLAVNNNRKKEANEKKTMMMMMMMKPFFWFARPLYHCLCFVWMEQNFSLLFFSMIVCVWAEVGVSCISKLIVRLRERLLAWALDQQTKKKVFSLFYLLFKNRKLLFEFELKRRDEKKSKRTNEVKKEKRRNNNKEIQCDHWYAWIEW